MAIQSKEHILTLLQDQHAELQRLGVRRCGLFGSFVRNEPHDQSDVDILVEFAPEQKTFDNFMRLATSVYCGGQYITNRNNLYGPELSDQGAFGCTPWVDFGLGYSAVLLIKDRTRTGTEIWNAIRPIIIQELSR